VASIPATLAAIEPLVPSGPIQPTRTVRLGARITLHGHWLINDEQHHRDAPVKVGELQVWDLVNETGMDHPFHCMASSSRSSRSTACRRSSGAGRTP
jgi:FtsP/CotA-like multicopper oxidase with cupredoxin domain